MIDGVNSTVDIDLGDCLACPYGKYKNSRGQWDSVCQNFQSCSLGRERLDASSASPGQCGLCSYGKYKDLTGNWTTLCFDCPVNAITEGLGSTALDECECRLGWAEVFLNDSFVFVCSDVDECSATVPATGEQSDQNDNCHVHAQCSNTHGSFTCLCTEDGYEEDPQQPDGTLCVPVCGDGLVVPEEECDLGYEAAGCTDECKCDAGWAQAPADISGLGSFCQDVNECIVDADTTPNNCDAAADCSNTEGSFTCVCQSTFEDRSVSGDGTLCASIDCGDGFRTINEECDDNNKVSGDGCSAKCEIEANFICNGGSNSAPDECQCSLHWYSPTNGNECSRFCGFYQPDDIRNTCNSHGACHPTLGYCECDTNYFGNDCSVLLTPLEQANITLGAGEAGQISMSGVSLDIPSGALTSAVTIGAGLFNPADLPSSMIPSRRAAQSQNLTIHSALVDFKPDGLTFAKDATLQMDASSPGLNLKIGTFDPDSEKWIPLESSSTATSGKLTASLSHFSLYAVVNVPIVTVTPSTPAPNQPPPAVSITPKPGLVLTPPKEETTSSYLVIIIILVAVGVLILCFTGAALYVRRMRMSPGKQKYQKLVFDDEFVEPIPGMEDDEDLVSPDWSLCTQCQKPVRNTWMRCPSCRCNVPPEAQMRKKLYTDSGFEIPVLLPSLDEDQLEDLLPPAAEPKAECMPRLFRAAPGAKALATRKKSVLTKSTEEDLSDDDWEDHPLVSDFSIECQSCQAPMKPAWERCPLCKTPAAETGTAGESQPDGGQGLQPDHIDFELQADTTQQGANNYLSPEGVSDALFTGDSLFAKRANVTDSFFTEDLPSEVAPASEVEISLAGVVDAADVGIDLDAMASDVQSGDRSAGVSHTAITSAIPTIEGLLSAAWAGIDALSSSGSFKAAPEKKVPTSSSGSVTGSAAQRAADLDSNALSTLNKWLDGMSVQSVDDVQSETGTMATFATGLASVEIRQQDVDGQSQVGLESTSASVALGPVQAEAKGLDAGLDGFSTTGLESVAARFDGLTSIDSNASRFGPMESGGGFAPALEGLAEEGDEDMPLAAAEQLGLYLDGLASGNTASVSGYEASSHRHGDAKSVVSEASKFSHFTHDDRVPVPASIAASSTVDAADLQGLQLDGLTSAHDFMTAVIPGLEAGAHQLTWEEEREQALAAESSVDFYAPSMGSDSWAPVSAPQTGLQSIDERTPAEALEAVSLGINLDGMDSSVRRAPSVLSTPSVTSTTGTDIQRQNAAAAALDGYVGGLASAASVFSASHLSHVDAMSSVASIDSRGLEAVTEEPWLGQDAESFSASSVIDARHLPDLMLDDLGVSPPDTAVQGLQSMDSTFSQTFGPVDTGLESSNTVLARDVGVDFDALASGTSRVTHAAPQPGMVPMPELDSLAEVPEIDDLLPPASSEP